LKSSIETNLLIVVFHLEWEVVRCCVILQDSWYTTRANLRLLFC